MLKKLCIIILLIVISHAVNAKIRIYKNVDVTMFPESLRLNLGFHEWEKGFLDVTQPPYNAKGDGITDDTEAIQKAINDAFACNLVLFFPVHTFLISNQLTCIQPAGPNLPNPPITSTGQRKFGHILLGSEKNGEWPILKLKDKSNVKENILILFQYIGIDGKPDASRHYLASIRNFNIEMGDNPDVSALSNDGAQHSVIENIKITGNFNVGISALPGSGGYAANISIIGGKIGIHQKYYRPNPTVFGLYLEGQSVNAIKINESRGAVTFSGFKIVGPPATETFYKAIDLYNNKSGVAEQGARANLNLTDGSIETFNDSPVITSYKQDVVVKDVYFKCQQIANCGTYSSVPLRLDGNTNNWLRLTEYIYSTNAGNGSVFIDKQNKRTEGQDHVSYSNFKEEQPPLDLLSRHLWAKMPSWEDDILDITTYGATRDDNSNNDAIAIQQAIDAIANPQHPDHDKVLFIPRGHFHIKSPIVIKKGVKVIGAGKNIAIIMVDETWKPTSAVSAVSTENCSSSGIVLSDFGLVCYDPIPELIAHKYITLLDLKSGSMIFRDVQTDRQLKKYQDGVYEFPMVKMNGSISGKFYGICLDYGTRGLVKPGYKLLSVNDAADWIQFYQLSIENTSDAVQDEPLNHMEIRNCNQVSIWGFKYENQAELLHVINTEKLEIYGGSGNYSICDPTHTSIFRFENTHFIYIANTSRSPINTEVANKSFVYDDGLLVSDDAPITLYRKQGFSSASFQKKDQPSPVELIANPVTDVIQMQVNSNNKNQQLFYTIYDLQGFPITKGDLLKYGVNNIPCQNFPKGYYFLTVTLNEQYKTWKILKN